MPEERAQLTGEMRVVKSFLEYLKVELITRPDNGRQALRFENLKPGYRQSVTIELDALPVEMLVVMNLLLAKPRGTESQAGGKGPSAGTQA